MLLLLLLLLLTEIISREDNAVFEFQAQDRGSRHGGRLCVALRCWCRPLLEELRGVVGAVDVVSGLGVGGQSGWKANQKGKKERQPARPGRTRPHA
jgi:hypothetical protein